MNPKRKAMFRMTNSEMVLATLRSRSNLKACGIAADCGLYGPALSGTLAALERRGVIGSSFVNYTEKIYFIREAA